MNDRFDNYMNGVLRSESTILEDIQTTTIPRNSLDPVVFQYTADGPPTMQGQIATQMVSTDLGPRRCQQSPKKIPKRISLSNFFYNHFCTHSSPLQNSPLLPI